MIELIKETYHQRFYKLDFKIKNIDGVFKTIKELKIIEYIEGHLLKEWELFDNSGQDYIDKICISDATTHIERLVFPCFYFKNKNTNEVIINVVLDHICGKHTLMIDGGDTNSIYDDKVYLRRLKMLNR